MTATADNRDYLAEKVLPGLAWSALWALSWLPGFLLSFFARILHAVLFLFLQYREEVVRENLRRSFPEKKEPERAAIAGRFYRHFSELWLEMVIYARLHPKKNSRRIRFTDSSLIDRAYAERRDLIIVSGHYGNWEWSLLPILAAGYRILAVYKPQVNPFADQLMRRLRTKPGITLVPMKDTLRVLELELGHRESPIALLLVADQIPARIDIRFWTRFLNQETAFFTGCEKLSRRFRLEVLYLDQTKKRFGRYEAGLERLTDGTEHTSEGDVTRRFAHLLEKSIRKEPSLWLWSHRRWKYPKQELPLDA